LSELVSSQRSGFFLVHHTGFDEFFQLVSTQVSKLHLQLETAQNGFVQTVEVVGGRQQDTLKQLQANHDFIDGAYFPTAPSHAPAVEEGVSLIEQQDRTGSFRFVEHGGDILFGLTSVLVQKVASGLEHKGFFRPLGQLLCIGGFTGAGRAIQANLSGSFLVSKMLSIATYTIFLNPISGNAPEQ